MKTFLLLLSLTLAAGGLFFKADMLQAREYKAHYRTFKGAKAIDGDTFYYKGKRYRIQQYNAPEIGQSGAREATKRLQQKLNSGQYVWKPVAKDVYKRTIVREKKR